MSELAKLAFEGKIVLPDGLLENGLVIVKGERIVYVGERIPLDGHYEVKKVHGYLWPGLIDIHVHGSGGANVLDDAEEALPQMARSLLRFGVTGFLPTTMSVAKPVLAKAVSTIVRSASRIHDGAEVLGIHLEGPWLSPHYMGAQNPSYLAAPSETEAEWAVNTCQGMLKLVTLAPESSGALEAIRVFAKNKVVVALGHAGATWVQVETAVEAGASHVTHIFNAMRGLHHREPGMAGAALAEDRLSVELIADGLHVHPAIIKLLTRVKTPDQLLLISDGISAVGMQDGEYQLGGLPIVVREGQAALKNGTLAGSLLTLNKAVFNMIYFTNIPLWQAVRMASLAPAKKLGIANEYGSIENGKKANLVVVDEAARVEMVYREGKQLYRRSAYEENSC